MTKVPEGGLPRRCVSVVVATYNRASYITECLDSLLNQTCKPDEILVVDDGSTDETPEIIARYGTAVHYIRKENGGKPSAVNLGLSLAQGDWIWCFDDDDVAEPDALERSLDALSADPLADFAFSGQIIGVDGPDGRIVRRHAVPAPKYSPDVMFHHALKEFPFRTQGMLISRRAFEGVGGFDERYVRGQDYEFILRVLRRCRGVRIDRPIFVWRVHEGPRGPQHARHDGVLRNLVWMQFAQLLGRDLRSTLQLSEYLPHRVKIAPLSPELRRQALIHRMAVMASKGLLPEMLEDLAEAASIQPASGQAVIDQDEAEACWKAATYEYFVLAFLASTGETTARMAALARTPIGRTIVWRIARGLLFSCRFADISWRDRLLLLGCSIRLGIAARF